MGRFLSCPFSYEQHYIKRIRPIKTRSPLFFGIGLDSGLNSLLLKSKTKPLDAYRNSVKHIELGMMEPSRYDYDKYLIPYQAKKDALKFLKTLGYKGNNCDELWESLLEKKKLSKKQEKALDFLGRLSLEYKALALFDAYKEQILPKIKKVLAVQKNVGPGILDIKLVWEDGKIYIADNKSASTEYDETQAEYDFQMTSYAIEEKVDDIMFIVLPKKIDKVWLKTCKKCNKVCKTQHQTCPVEKKKVRCAGEFKTEMKLNIVIQVVTGSVTKMMKTRTKEIQDKVCKTIEGGNFPCNFASCSNQYGRPCEYRDLYWKGSMEGLKKVPDSKGRK